MPHAPQKIAFPESTGLGRFGAVQVASSVTASSRLEKRAARLPCDGVIKTELRWHENLLAAHAPEQDLSLGLAHGCNAKSHIQ
jgi:hypothetical protein